MDKYSQQEKDAATKHWMFAHNFIMIGVTYINAFLSFRYGFLGDKNYWFCLLLLMVSLENVIKSKEREQICSLEI